MTVHSRPFSGLAGWGTIVFVPVRPPGFPAAGPCVCDQAGTRKQGAERVTPRGDSPAVTKAGRWCLGFVRWKTVPDKPENFMRGRSPDLRKRRVFFVAQPRSVGGAEDLLVYTYWGDRIQEDLRHELTHALLHSVLRDVPLWLDEGLAEYFEVPPERQGINAQHLDHLRHNPNGPFQPNLARLEALEQVKQMTPAEYREAWAWVHLM